MSEKDDELRKKPDSSRDEGPWSLENVPGSDPELLPVTGELYSDITLEELEERLELQALLDGDLGADLCYSRCSQQCTEQSGTIISSSQTTIVSSTVATTRPPEG